MVLLGFSQIISPSIYCIEDISLKQRYNYFGAFFILRLVSPSSPLVSVKQMPFSSLELIITISHGIYWSPITLTTCPTLISCQSIDFSPSLLTTITYILFSLLSFLCLLQSSNASFIIDHPIQVVKGISIIGFPAVIDIILIVLMKALIRK